MTRRENSTKRRAPHRDPATMLLVVCGAGKTEPVYLKQLNRHSANRQVSVTVTVREDDPKNIVQWVRRNSPDYDQVWCVTDVDEFDIDGALRAAAGSNNIELAISNPCFEYWLLLHFEDCRTPMTRCGEEVTPRLRRYVPTYDKTALRFADFADAVDAAVARARRRCPERGAEHGTNPSTGVWELVDMIRGTPDKQPGSVMATPTRTDGKRSERRKGKR